MSEDTLKIIQDIREKFGMDVENLIRIGILPTNAAKKWLVGKTSLIDQSSPM